jgi:hypothetical protein
MRLVRTLDHCSCRNCNAFSWPRCPILTFAVPSLSFGLCFGSGSLKLRTFDVHDHRGTDCASTFPAQPHKSETRILICCYFQDQTVSVQNFLYLSHRLFLFLHQALFFVPLILWWRGWDTRTNSISINPSLVCFGVSVLNVLFSVISQSSNHLLKFFLTSCLWLF